ncbi:MAG TPA: hypothetical protein VFI27_02590 [candidate division Zixibacteria bacterium]|nr:hypothetical protein [candidate division Zixibacteria bacterium]
MKQNLYPPWSVFWRYLAGFLLVTGILSGCAALEIGRDFTPEPGVEGFSPAGRGALSTVVPGSDATASTVPTSTPSPVSGADQGDQPSPSPTPTSTPTPALPTSTPTDVGSTIVPTPSPNIWTPTRVLPPGPQPTPTPVAPLPGLVFSDQEGLWWTTARPVQLSTRPDAMLSPDGQYLLYQQGDDIWLQVVATGEERNLTGGTGRVHCCARWWPARPDTLVFGSWPIDADIGPTTGFLSAIKIDGTEYRVLDEEVQSNGLPGPGPDGQTIAYDRGGSSWLYRWDIGSEPLDPVAFGLQNVVRIGGPAYSADGQQLAWTVAITDPEWRIAVAVFDLPSRTARLIHPYENAGRGGWFPAPVWSPDGRWLAFTTEDLAAEARGVWVAAADGSQELYLGPGWGPIWNPDGRFLAYNSIDNLTNDQSIPRLVLPDSWYQIPFALSPGSSVVGWIQPGD